MARRTARAAVDAVLSVVSSFSGDNEFFSHELLNLMARTNISTWDGVRSMARRRPLGKAIARDPSGRDCVATDALCMAVMGYDPLAVRGTPPFEKCDSTLQLAEESGVGPRDLRRIELLGEPVRDALFQYRV
jgi:hypothetical protein